MTHKIYAGIGSRKTPNDVCDEMTSVAQLLAACGWRCRSGGARQADTAFERGTKAVNPAQFELFLALNATRQPAWFNHARKYHPRWPELTREAQQLHARNSAIMLGADLQTPVRFVICWTPDCKVTGGTGQALRIAAEYSIPVFNMCDPGAVGRMWSALGGLS